MQSPVPSPSLLTSTLFLLSFSLIPTTILAATGLGSVSIWSDAGCGTEASLPAFSLPRLIALNLTLPADTCHNLPRTGHSYAITEWPICNDGREADWTFFNGNDCPEGDSQDLGFGSTALEGYSLSGLCLALVEFDSVAFVCEGVGKGDSGSGDTTIEPSSTVTSRSDLVVGSTTAAQTTTATSLTDLVVGPTGTPIAPGASPTYTIFDTSGYTLAPTGTAAPSGTGVGGGQGIPPSPSPFTGAAAGKTIGFGGVISGFVFGVVVLMWM